MEMREAPLARSQEPEAGVMSGPAEIEKTYFPDGISPAPSGDLPSARCRERKASLFLMVALLVEILSAKPAMADVAIATASGTITNGTDYTGVFGPPDTSLVGAPFAVVYTINDSLVPTVPVGNPPYYSVMNCTTTIYPITATMTINGKTVSSNAYPIQHAPSY